MSFSIDQIPANNRSRQQIEAHRELYLRTQDSCRVHNPTEKDYVVYNDRRFSNEQYVVPGIRRDIGYGKGNNDVPRFIAMRYLEKMGNILILQKIRTEWAEEKKKFRLEERGVMEERLSGRTNNPKYWDEITKVLFLGVVKRYQSDIITEPEPQERKHYNSQAEAALDRLEMTDTEIGIKPVEASPIIDNKEQFLQQIQ